MATQNSINTGKPIEVSNGGTGAATLTGVLIGNGTSAVTAQAVTQHDVLVGGASNAITSVAPSATSGIPLVSGGASADPSFTTAVVAGGGTGATTLTSHGVLLGNTTSAITATAAGTTGQVLTGVTGSDPTFQSPAASSISITGNSGGALTGNAFTFTGGTTGLTFAGAGSTETLGGTLAVANGGTGVTTIAAAPYFKTIVRQVFTSSGTYTPTAGMIYCDIECVGGGGGGGSVPTTAAANIAMAGSGGAGEYARGIFSAATIGVSK